MISDLFLTLLFLTLVPPGGERSVILAFQRYTFSLFNSRTEVGCEIRLFLFSSAPPAPAPPSHDLCATPKLENILERFWRLEQPQLHLAARTASSTIIPIHWRSCATTMAAIGAKQNQSCRILSSSSSSIYMFAHGVRDQTNSLQSQDALGLCSVVSV